MSKPKIQHCLSFKNTKEELMLYEYLLDQPDKSVFLKNLIRKHMCGDKHSDGERVPEIEKIESSTSKGTGKKTKNKFLL